MSLLPEQAILKLLVSDVDVGALVSTRVSIGYSEEGDVTPYITITRIPGGTHNHHFGASSGLAYGRLQIDYFSDSYVESVDLAEKGRQALDGFTGDVVVGAETFTFQQLHIIDDESEFIREKGQSDSGIQRISHDYRVGHAEAVPTF